MKVLLRIIILIILSNRNATLAAPVRGLSNIMSLLKVCFSPLHHITLCHLLSWSPSQLRHISKWIDMIKWPKHLSNLIYSIYLNSSKHCQHLMVWFHTLPRPHAPCVTLLSLFWSTPSLHRRVTYFLNDPKDITEWER